MKSQKIVDTTPKELGDLPTMPPLEDDEEDVKEGKGIKIVIPNKLSTRLLVLLAQKRLGIIHTN